MEQQKTAYSLITKTLRNKKQLDTLSNIALANSWMILLETDDVHLVEDALPNMDQLVRGGFPTLSQSVLKESSNPALIGEAGNLSQSDLEQIRFCHDSTRHTFIIVGPIGWIATRTDSAFQIFKSRCACSTIFWYN